MTDLDKAFNEIRSKRPQLDLMFSYADGPQPLKYSTERLTDYFRNINTHFELNWCSVIVDSTLDRIQLAGFDTEDDSINARMAILFDKLHLDIEADKAHHAALSTSQGYIIVWKEDDGEIVAFYNDPRLCAVFYDPAKPMKKTYAAKWFNRTDGTQEITLYYPQRLEHWVSAKVQTGTSVDKASAFTLEGTETNPYNVIPVFEITTQSEIVKVVTIQDAINKLFADMMVSSDFSTTPMRWYIGNADPGAVKNAPNLWAWFPAGDGQGQQSSVGQFDATGLNNFSVEMDNLANRMFVITRTPKHYLMTSGSNISGEALLAMEAPLVKKCQKKQRTFSAQWQDIAQFLLQLDGVTIDASTIWVMWDKIESTQPKTEAETVQIGVNTGIPLVTLLKRNGWGDDEIASMMDDKKAMDEATKTAGEALLNTLRIRGQQNPPLADKNQDTNQDTLPNGG